MQLQAQTGAALNLGRIEAGRIDLQAAVVNQQGLLRATSLSSEGGRIELKAASTLDLSAQSQTQATGPFNGGQIVADAGRLGTLLVAGDVQADASQASGKGGQIQALGQNVGVLDTAVLSASGPAGGGKVQVGGGLQGKDSTVPNAEAVYIGPGARLSADATTAGDGGQVIVWSDKATRVYGSFSARGGADSGNGGLVETSGHWLDAQPAKVDTTAAKGKAGQWLLDPFDLQIVSGDATTSVTSGPLFTTDATGPASVGVLAIATALQSGNNVALTTSANGGSLGGDITMDSVNLAVTLPSLVTLTFNAFRDITLNNARIETGPASSPLNVTFNPALGNTTNPNGAAWLTNSTINTPGGTISLFRSYGRDIERVTGARISASNLTAEAITIQGTGGDRNQSVPIPSGAKVEGILIETGSNLTATTISINGEITSSAPLERSGVRVDGSTISASNSLTIRGKATGGISIGRLSGVEIGSLTELSISGDGGMIIDGEVVSGTPGLTAAGVRMGISTLQSTNGAPLSISGKTNTITSAVGIDVFSPLVQTRKPSIDANFGGNLSITSNGPISFIDAQLQLPNLKSATIDSGSAALDMDTTRVSGAPASLTVRGGSVSLTAGGHRSGRKPNPASGQITNVGWHTVRRRPLFCN